LFSNVQGGRAKLVVGTGFAVKKVSSLKGIELLSLTNTVWKNVYLKLILQSKGIFFVNLTFEDLLNEWKTTSKIPKFCILYLSVLKQSG
jgi:hypothetical protein